ncbi:MAG: bifunctional demethylmenaquinone methyltransferase/2-methoxy-6-polyprenyl,4-benzoquinol methylase [Bacteroidota bacterium]|jgi:demethylmenaquinone methyltransferase/2-methoxy-6-polyprenyl-1,4-benzoquinol methylase
MEVKPYSEAGSKKEQVAKMFDNIAGHYDFLNHFLSLGVDRWWRKKAIEHLVASQPKMVLDVATGTADLALAIAKTIGASEVEGIDISNEMLNVGREKVKKAGLERVIRLNEGDSEKIPFADNNFDAVSVAYGVRNFEHLEQGLSEMYRVLKPNGRVVVLEFSRPTAFPLKQLFNFYFKNILPLIGRLTSRDSRAYSYLYESVQTFPDGENFVKLLEKVGFRNAQCKPLTFGITSIYVAEKV